MSRFVPEKFQYFIVDTAITAMELIGSGAITEIYF